MRKIIIIHFRPIELYPPSLNLLRLLNKRNGINILVLTSISTRIPPKNIVGIKIIRCFQYESCTNNYIVNKLLTLRYFLFILYSLFFLIKNSYSAIIYFESISSLPIIIARKISKKVKRTRLFIHYHEYFSPSEIKKQMKLEQLGYYLERSILKTAIWVSHTNEQRARFFEIDQNLPNESVFILPNYPPSEWLSKINKSAEIDEYSSEGKKLHLVYIGALSTQNMYLTELVQWLITLNGKITLDIYSIELRPDVENLLLKFSRAYIRHLGPIPYDQIPSILPKYDVGLVLYNKNSMNFIYNAPNKIFEYWACGLDVWFSIDLISSFKHKTDSNIYPSVIPVNFSNLENFAWQYAVQRKDKIFKPSPHYAENVLIPFINKIENENTNP